MVLRSQPTADVTMPIASSNTAEGTVGPAALTFTAANWSTPQTVTVTGVDDFVADGAQPYTVTIGPATSTDALYAALPASSVPFTNEDNDVAGITVGTPSGTSTSESGTFVTFTVVLKSQPTADVTIPLGSSNPAEGTVSPASLTFTAASWNAPQTVTVTGVDDFVADGPQSYAVAIGPATSVDANYGGLHPADLTFTNTDNDVAGITVGTPSGPTTSEAGTWLTFTVVLTSKPIANVTVPIASGNPSEGVVSPDSLLFTAATWNVPQTVTVTGVDDFVMDGPKTYAVAIGPAASADAGYQGVHPADLTFTNLDNDVAGLSVGTPSGTTTSESGTSATFTVVLRSQPTADVTVPIASGNTAEGVVAPAALTFTAATWSTPQTVTVTGVDDQVADGPQPYVVSIGPAVSADAGYAGAQLPGLPFTNTDNDVAGINIGTPSGTSTSEAGTSVTFTVALNTQPTADVTIPLGSSNPAEGSVSPAALTFTSANWATPQTVTVTGVDDFVADGTQPYMVAIGPATSTDSSYGGISAASLAFTNTDDDVAGITIGTPSGASTSEAGTSVTFTVVLTSQPTADVTVPLASTNPAEGAVSPASLTFTAADWMHAADGHRDRRGRLRGGRDAAVHGRDRTGDEHGDAGYSGTSAVERPARERGQRRRGDHRGDAERDLHVGGGHVGHVHRRAEVAADGGRHGPARVAQHGGGHGFAGEPDVHGGELEHAADGDRDRRGRLRGGRDAAVHRRDRTGDERGRGLQRRLPRRTSQFTNTDNDVAGITVGTPSGTTTSEAGTWVTFTVVLTSKPIANVTVPIASGNPSEGVVSPDSLLFTAATWNVPQTVTVTGVDDFVMDGSKTYAVAIGPATSADAGYQGVHPADLTFTNLDNDVAGLTVGTPTGTTTAESGTSATFTVALRSQPTADVTVPLASSNTAEGAVSPASLTFTTASWNTPQTVTVTGVDDLVADGPQPYVVSIGPAVSADAGYAGAGLPGLPFTNSDNDLAGISVGTPTGASTSETGTSLTFTVVLTSQPTGDVTISLASSNPAEGAVSPASLTFTAASWNTPQTVTVTGVDDFVADGTQPYTVAIGPATSTDTGYGGLSAAGLPFTNTDNDVAGISVGTPSGTSTSELGTSVTFTVALASQPTADVTVPIASSNPAEAAASPASLTFTAADWMTPQTVTVTGVDDFVADGTQPYTVAVGPATSTDTGYSGLSASGLPFTNTDNDVAGITVGTPSGTSTSEAGTSVTFTVVLQSQPTADVTIPLSSSDTAEGTVSPATLTFTAASWSTPQTVTVTGVDDFVADGPQPYAVSIGPATSADAKYGGIRPADLTFTNTDDDSAGITVGTPTGATTSEAGTWVTFTIVLTSKPTADVTVPIASSKTAEGVVSPASLTFTATSWNTPQTVTVTGVDDFVMDGPQTYAIAIGPATSADASYQGIHPADVTFTNLDNDVAGISLGTPTGTATTEAGAFVEFTVVLRSQPTADVTVPSRPATRPRAWSRPRA